MTYKTQRVFGDGILSRISHMRTSTRLLYVFYSLIHTVSPRIDIVDLTDGIFNPVYWVSLDQKTTRLSLILFKVYSILEATYALNPSEAILIILG